MAIKIIETFVPEKPYYPVVCKHKDHDDLIVLFTSRSVGVCLSPEDHPSYGKHTVAWESRENTWIPIRVTIDSTGIA